MARSFDETEWLTRTTTPLRLARYIQNRISNRQLQILSSAACRLIERHISAPLLDDLQTVERFAFGELSGSEYHRLISSSMVSFIRENELFDIDDSLTHSATQAVIAACSGNVVEGMVSTIGWVLETGTDDKNLPAKLCDLFREIVGNPFRPWIVYPEWIDRWNRTAPDGTTHSVTSAMRDIALTIDREGRFELLPILADELEMAGWNDPALLHHCRNGTGHRRGCWVADLILGRD